MPQRECERNLLTFLWEAPMTMYSIRVWLKDNSLDHIFEAASISDLEAFLASYFEVPETRFIELYRDGTWLDSVSSLADVRSALARA